MAPVPALPLLLASIAPGPGAAPPPEPLPAPLQQGRLVSEEDLRKAWSYLHPDEQHEVVEWFRLECSQRDTFQLRLLRDQMRAIEVDPGLLHDAVPPEVFDPEVHAPKNATKRKWLESGSSKVESLVEKTFGDLDPRRIRSAFVYDWGTRQIRRATPLSDQDLFEHGILGYPPDVDIVRALVIAKLDRGEEQVALGAFAHCYTDRKGNAYPGVTLYDVWSSGNKIEMPDSDTLGIVHVALGDWSTWKAPVSGSQQLDLYRAIEDVFTQARRYRGLRESLADLYLIGNPPPTNGYGPHYERLHALWEQNGSSPEALAKVLPDADHWEEFLQEWFKLVDDSASLRSQGNRRRRLLGQNESVVRECLTTVLDKFGAFDRTRLPKRQPPRAGD